MTELRLGGNSIGDEGAKAIAEALKSGSSVLTSINLSYNELTGPYPYNHMSGITAICEMLKVNGVMTSLDLSNNFLDAEAGKALASMLEVNSALKKLDLQFNHLGDGAGTVRKSVEGREGFELLGIDVQLDPVDPWVTDDEYDPSDDFD